MKTISLRLCGLALAALAVGCQTQVPVLRAPAATPVGSATPVRSGGQVELTIRWPYRAQVIPTSTQRLVLQISGPQSRREVLNRPAGEAPLSVTTLDLEAGDAYEIAVEAYDGTTSELPVATGRSAPFDAVANKKLRVTVTLQATYVSSVLSVSPDNGGPGTLVTVLGENFGLGRGLWPLVRFEGLAAEQGVQAGPAAVTVRIPNGARSGLVGVTVDGVPDAGSTASFTVLASLGIEPASAILAPGGTFDFTARATTDAGVAYASPSVTWSLMTRPNPAYEDPGPEGEPSGSPYLPTLGTMDEAGRFVSNGTAGIQWLQIVSGSLTATAAIEVQ